MYVSFGIIASITYRLLLRAENARRDRGERDELIDSFKDEKGTAHGRSGRFSTVDDAKREKGDEWSGYRYTL
jgi:hypothetical protein